MAAERLMVRFFVVATILCLSGFACRQQETPVQKPETCFQEMERASAGRIQLSKPVNCARSGKRYRLEGTIERPREVTALGDDGSTLATYRIEYDKAGRVSSEERILRVEPGRVKVFHKGDRMEFQKPIGKSGEHLRIHTELDPRGRILQVKKFVGSTLSFRMIREYEGSCLGSETVYDGKGGLRYRSEYSTERGRRIERMRDASGKSMLEREIGADTCAKEEVLDTSRGSPVQVGNPRKTGD